MLANAPIHPVCANSAIVPAIQSEFLGKTAPKGWDGFSWKMEGSVTIKSLTLHSAG